MASGEGFQPRYIGENELTEFGLPDNTEQPGIINLVDAASSLIDEYCGRTDGDGNGSLVYTTYVERLLLPEGRNIMRTMFRPLVGISVSTHTELAASGANYFTGFTPNDVVQRNGTLSSFISASGRYGYARRGQQQVYPDLNYGANILQIASFFGGPPQFTNIDVSDIDFDPRTAEIWIPAGLYLSAYTEILISYNSGFDPRNMPKAIKHSCAALVKNFITRAGGTTGLRSLSAGRVSSSFTDELIDPTVQRWLSAYVTVLAY